MHHVDPLARSSEVLREREPLWEGFRPIRALSVLPFSTSSTHPAGAMATAWGYSTAPFVSNGLVQTPLDRVSANAATPPPTDSQLLPAPPPAAMLPPPPPARDLHGARARITLEKVKLEIETVREVLGDVNGLGEAVKGLQNQVELLLAERAAKGTHGIPKGVINT